MKKICYFLLSVLGFVAITSCDSEKECPTNPLAGKNKVKLQGIIGESVSSRASGTTWDLGDAIGVYALNGGQTLPSGIYDMKENIKYTTPGDGNFTEATTAITFPESGNLDFIAYYPYKNTIENYAYAIDVSDQSKSSAIDLLYSNNAKGANKGTPVVPLEFRHKLSLLVLNVSAGSGVNTLNGLTSSVSGLNTDGSFNLVDGTLTLGSTSNVFTPAIATSGESRIVTAILVPGQNLNSAAFSFTLNGKKYEWKPSSQTLESGKKYTYSLQLSTSGVVTLQPAATIIDWEDGNTGSAPIVLTPDETAQFSVDKTSISIAASGTLTDVIHLTTQSDQAWTATSNQSWLTLTSNGTGSAGISVTAEENTTSSERTATITITAGGTSSFAPISVTVTQAKASVNPPANNLLFPSSDFNDWNAFTGSLNKYGLSADGYASQSTNGGIDDSGALSLSGTPTKNDYTFTAKVPSAFSTSGKTKISFYIKGTASKSLSLNVYVGTGTSMGTDYKCFNLGDCSSAVTLEATDANSYTGTINTSGQWVKVSLDISGLVLNSTAGDNLFALKVGKTSPYDLLVDDITLE